MSVKQNPKNPESQLIDCRPDGYKGRRVRLEFFGSREGALKVERDLMRRVEIEERPRARNIKGIYPQFIGFYKANRAASTAADLENCWRSCLQHFFGSFQPEALNRAAIEEYKRIRIATGVTPRTVSKELSYLAALIKWAVANDHCDPIPFTIEGFPRKMTRPPKPRPLTPGQISGILVTIDPKYRLIFLLMADAGLRLSEALRLRREDVEYDHGVMYIIGKGNKERIVPITTDRLRDELDKRRGFTGFLSVHQRSGKPFYSIRKALQKAAEKAGIEKHVYHHLLRHSFGTNATAAHLDAASLQAIMGHSSPQTTNMYQHLAGEYLRSQGRKLNDMVKMEEDTDRQPPHGQAK